MTRREFYKKLEPSYDKWLDYFRGNGEFAIASAFSISFVKEFMWRLDCEADDKSDDIPFFDEVDPWWFMIYLRDIAAEWDDAPKMLLGDDEGFEMYQAVVRELERNWRIEHGKED